MPHNRTNIRNALEAAFAALTFPVEIERRHRIDGTLRPLAVLSLTATGEESGNRSMGSPTYPVEHEQTCLIELHADGANGRDVAEELDSMEFEIEQALAADLELGGLCELIEPVESELEMTVDQTPVIGKRAVTYLISWRARFGSPDTPEA